MAIKGIVTLNRMPWSGD